MRVAGYAVEPGRTGVGALVALASSSSCSH